jgi:hypothetical protein
MKYRIKQVGNRYYPQYKFLCFWCNFDEVFYRDCHRTVSRPSLLEAKQFIQFETIQQIDDKTVTIHPYP